MMDWGLLQDAAQMKLDVLSAVRFIEEGWRLITTNTVKNCFVKCGFSNDHVSSNDDSAVKLREDEEDEWYSLQALGVQFEKYKTCGDSTFVLSELQSIDQVLEQHLTRSEEEEEVAEHKAIFLDALKRLETSRKYMCQFDSKNNIVQCWGGPCSVLPNNCTGYAT
jgi:hypothetical protein